MTTQRTDRPSQNDDGNRPGDGPDPDDGEPEPPEPPTPGDDDPPPRRYVPL
jgi:hypothetical protein